MSEERQFTYAVEAQDHRGDWQTVETFFGYEYEIKPEAEATYNRLLAKGWPKNLIRISKSEFKSLTKKFRED